MSGLSHDVGGLGVRSRIPANLIGAKIIDIGRCGDGQLAIDYRPRKSERVTRVVIHYSDCGLYCEQRERVT